jgi:3D (Asp-Asp-Asp) domain-containing protein
MDMKQKKGEAIRVAVFAALLVMATFGSWALAKNIVFIASSMTGAKYSLDLSELRDEIQANKDEIDQLRAAHQTYDVQKVTVTAYTPAKRETNSNPGHTAVLWHPKPGMIAVSRDLLRKGWAFGSKVYIEGLGVFFVGDLMNKRHKGRIDVLLFNREAARVFGRKKGMTAVSVKEVRRAKAPLSETS